MWYIPLFRMTSHRTMKPIGCYCEQGITGGNLSGFAAWQFFTDKYTGITDTKTDYTKLWR